MWVRHLIYLKKANKQAKILPVLCVVILLGCMIYILAACGNYRPINETEKGPSTDIQLPIGSVSEISPNGLYLAENYGVETNLVSGGKHPAEGIRLKEIASGKVLWNMTPGYYDCTFLWSSDSNYLSVSYTARTEGSIVIVNTEDFTELSVPLPNDIKEKLHEYRPDVYQKGWKWIEDKKLNISLQWIGKDDKTYAGTYNYNPATGEITDVQMNEGIISG